MPGCGVAATRTLCMWCRRRDSFDLVIRVDGALVFPCLSSPCENFHSFPLSPRSRPHRCSRSNSRMLARRHLQLYRHGGPRHRRSPARRRVDQRTAGNATDLGFTFTSFLNGVFEFDCDTNGTGITGGDMAGMAVTVTVGGTVRSGVLALDPDNPQRVRDPLVRLDAFASLRRRRSDAQRPRHSFELRGRFWTKEPLGQGVAEAHLAIAGEAIERGAFSCGA